MGETILTDINNEAGNVRLRIWVFSVVTAALFLFVGTASSPLFPYNVWNDANCFFTVGKSIFKGKVLYQDIFEQKGLYQYVIYGIGSMVSKSSFLGVYFLEVIFFTVFLAYAARLLLYYVRERFIYAVLPVFSVLILVSPCFEKGGSSEEFCLPFFMILLCHAVECFDRRGKGITAGKMVIDGVLFSLVFWIKFNLVFLIVGVYFGYLLYFIQKKQWVNLKKIIFCTLLGVGIGTLPVLLYFVLNHALRDLWFGYFYANLFLYHGQDQWMYKAWWLVKNMVWYIKQNWLCAVLILLGILGFTRRHRENMGASRIFLPISVILCIIGCIAIPTVVGVYYHLPLMVFAIFGFIEIIELSKDKICIGFHPWRLALVMTACVVLVLFGSNAYFLLQIPKDELPQMQFAKIINQKENPTVLNYRCLDTGIYTIAGVEPPTKFFCRLNLEYYKEMHKAQDRIVKKQKVDFVVTLENPRESDELLNKGYELIAEKYLGSTKYQLYQKKE